MTGGVAIAAATIVAAISLPAFFILPIPSGM
jgi:hypothetical protein